MTSTDTLPLTQEEFRLLTWPRTDWTTKTIDPECLQRQCPLDNGRHERSAVHHDDESSSVSTIGDLERLPLEINHMILDTLDLQTLTDFRAVNWLTRGLVDSLPSYKAIIRNAPNALRALLSTHTAFHFTAQNIFRTLCTRGCFKCGEFGPFLDLFTARRCCYSCLLHSQDLCTIRASLAKNKFRLGAKTMRSLSTLLGLPGEYSESGKMHRKRIPVVRLLSADAAAAQVHKDSKISEHTQGLVIAHPPHSPQFPRSPIVRHLLQHFDGEGQNSYRFMAVIRIPVLNKGTGSLDWGVCCQACRGGPRDENRGYRHWNTSYSFEEYAEHLQSCQLSQIGRKLVPEYIARTKKEQPMLDAKFLGFLDNFKF